MEIVTKDEFLVIGKKVKCGWEQLHKEMPEAWAEVQKRAHEVENRISTEFLDICLELVDEEFTQLVCVEVSDLHHIPNGFEGHRIPKQQYIYTKHMGSVMQIADVFGEMIQWGKNQNLTLDPLDFKIQSVPENVEEGYGLFFKIV